MQPSTDSDLHSALEGSLLSDLPVDAVQRLLAESIRIELPAGSALYREDDPPRFLLVIDGLIRVVMTAPSGREVTVRYARRGDVLGIPTIIGGPPPVSAQVVTDATALFLSARLLNDLARHDARIAWRLAEEVTTRLYDILDALADYAFGNLRQRIARHLLDLAASRRRPGPLVAPVSQQELADAVGSVRPAVGRVIGDLRAAGLVATTADGITILDPTGLYSEVFVRNLSQM